tara:strand:- start:46296 stop:46559 length:264 start_codon:yes stop_codon:yes gene_type:complete
MSNYGLVYYSVIGDGAQGTLAGYAQALKSIKELELTNVKLFPFGEDGLLDLLRNGFFIYGQRDDVHSLIDGINSAKGVSVIGVPVVS